MKMEFDLLRLKNNLDKNIIIDLTYSFPREMLDMTDLIELNNVHIVGDIHKDCLDNIVLSVNVSGTMVLPCAVTLKPVNYPFSINIEGNIEELIEEIDKNSKKFENTIDILPIIWENILMEIPMKVVSENAKDIHMEGEGWKLLTDDDEGNTNSPFEKLNEILK